MEGEERKGGKGSDWLGEERKDTARTVEEGGNEYYRASTRRVSRRMLGMRQLMGTKMMRMMKNISEMRRMISVKHERDMIQLLLVDAATRLLMFAKILKR